VTRPLGSPRPAGAGRKKGTPNKAKGITGKVPYVPALDEGEMPLAYMLRVMRDPTVAPERRDFMASKAAPYCHRQLKALEVTGPEGGPVTFAVTLAFD
jgi:hypothetical protein